MQQVGQLVWDVVMVIGLGGSLRGQRRLYVGEGGLRIEDWGVLGITWGVGIVRVLFLVGVGMGVKTVGRARKGE